MTQTRFKIGSKLRPCAKCNFFAAPQRITERRVNMRYRVDRSELSAHPAGAQMYDYLHVCDEVKILEKIFAVHIHHIARLITEFSTDDVVCMGCRSTSESEHAWNGEYGYNVLYGLREDGELDDGTWTYFRKGRWWRSAKQFRKQQSTRRKRVSRRCLDTVRELYCDGYRTWYGVEMGYYIDIRKGWWCKRPEPHWITRYRKKTGVTYPYLLIDEVVPELYRRIRKKCMLMRVEHAFKVFRSLLVS